MAPPVLCSRELAARKARGDCVVVVDGVAYDATKFLHRHPGGAQALLDVNGGPDCGATFHALHDPSALQHVERLGEVESAAVPAPERSMQEQLKGGGGHGSFVVERLERLDAVLSVEHMHREAAARLPPSLVRYIDYGAEDELSIRANERGWEKFGLVPRVLRDVKDVSLKTVFKLGAGPSNTLACRSPIVVAPFAGASAAYPQGEREISAAAAARGSVYCVPHYAGVPVDELDQIQGSPSHWFQVYAPCRAQDHRVDREYLGKVVAHVSSLSSFRAIVLTVDSPTFGNREKTYRDPHWVASLREECGGMPKLRALERLTGLGSHNGHSPGLNWEDVSWLKDLCSSLNLGLFLKGIMSPDDAIEAASRGVHGVIISNHGGRQLDGTVSTCQVAAACCPTIRKRFPDTQVFVDGGIRRGRDVFKAIAMGCSGVLVGRPVLWGLGCCGERGVAKILDTLDDELRRVMQLCGCSEIADIQHSMIAYSGNMGFSRI